MTGYPFILVARHWPFLMPRESMCRTVDDIIAEAATLPLRDAAYAIWREKSTFERLESRVWPQRDFSTPETTKRSMQEIGAALKYEHEFAQDGPTFDRLKRAHH